MTVTSTEFKMNLGKYLTLIAREDVIITKNGRKIAKLARVEDDALAALRSLRGAVPGLSAAGDAQIREMLADERGKRQ
jgi:prevent-host-death family protein